MAHLAAKERAIIEYVVDGKKLEEIRPVADEVWHVMRAYRYTKDDLEDEKVYGEWNNKTEFHEGNCLPTDEWKWPDGEMPTSKDELVRKVFETPYNHLKLFYGNANVNGDDQQQQE